MGENLSRKKSNKPFAAILIAVILIVSVVGVYVYTQFNQPSSAEKATPITNFSNGSWANYTVAFFKDHQAYPGAMMTYTVSGDWHNQDCWQYIENLTWTDDNGTWAQVDTYYLDKSTYQCIGQTSQTILNGATYSREEFTGENMSNDYARFSNMIILAKDASVTVPKGTFTCTEQQGLIHSAVQRSTYDVTVWVNSEVPNWGVVKYTFYLDGTPYSEFLLESYGS
jgi:hypothetical protein